MGKRRELGAMLKALLEQYYTVTPVDIGEDSRLSKSGMTFTTESYDVEGAGHLCILNMNAMLGLMKMETVVLSLFEKDMPLFNLDWVGAFGNETQIAELYDVQLDPYPQELLDEFTKIKEADSDIADYPSSPAWYDGILYPCTYHKKGKKITERLSAAASGYAETFCRQLAAAPACDAEAKKARVREFAETLFSNGGPAVDQVKKLFGDETARRLIVTHMYGVGQE